MHLRTRYALPCAALLLALPALTACGGSDAPTVSAPTDSAAAASTPSSAPTTPAPQSTPDTAAPTTSSTHPSSAPTPKAPASSPTAKGGDAGSHGSTKGKRGADSPEAAAQEFFRGMGSLKTKRSCTVATTQDGSKPLVSDPSEFELCVAGLKSAAKSITKAQRAGLAKIVVTKVKPHGDKATVGPDDLTVNGVSGTAGAGSRSIDCRRIDGRWYVDVSSLR